MLALRSALCLCHYTPLLPGKCFNTWLRLADRGSFSSLSGSQVWLALCLGFHHLPSQRQCPLSFLFLRLFFSTLFYFLILAGLVTDCDCPVVLLTGCQEAYKVNRSDSVCATGLRFLDFTSVPADAAAPPDLPVTFRGPDDLAMLLPVSLSFSCSRF
jgi:hypothetical protein